MTTTAPDPRAAFAEFTRALVEDLRAHDGVVTEGRFAGRPVLLLHTVGAKSGEARLAPLVYSKDGDRHVILASKGGAPVHPAWYVNLLANPIVTVEAEGETFKARAVVAAGAEHDRLYAAHAAPNPVFNEYQEKTTRKIPVVALERLREG